MGKTTIEWTAFQRPDGSWAPGYSFNPWVGCTKISAACDHCYAESWAKRTGQADLWEGGRRRTTPDNWRQPIKWDRAAAAAGERHRVFCASLADVFDNQVPVDWRIDLWRLIKLTPNLDWLLLTKRPQNAANMLPLDSEHAGWGIAWPWPNVWLGTTAENQAEADRRIPSLLRVPAAVHFVSAEPLLGALDLWLYLDPARQFRRRLGWVICGGESGPGARPMHPGWARSLRDQCQAAGAAYFHKQNGEFASCSESQGPGAIFKFPDGSAVRRVGKKRAGRLLGGVEHNGYPRAA